ncbi:large subunit GTPase 1 [Enteropsectra breve]|nr:large subunit GTPase 1 [Enteropsectra breve]
MSAKKKSGNGLAALLIADRFSDRNEPKKYIQRNSITEYTGLSMLSERLSVENKSIENSKDKTTENPIEAKYGELIYSLNYDLSIPPRVPFCDIEKGEYKKVEEFVFNRWKSTNSSKIFERNIEIWRQFWLTCERSETIAQIIDSRNPNFFINDDIYKMYPTKKHVIFYNKCDLSESFSKLQEYSHIPSYEYSAKTDVFEYDLIGTIGLIGYPNVGKSSTINLILNQKKVRVSSTPGKTKYLQTIETPHFTLFDCPGLVFPKHEKIDLVLMGILNIDQIPDLCKYEHHIVEKVGENKIKAFYKLFTDEEYVLSAMGAEKGWIKSKCLKEIVKNFTAGLIPYN